MENMFIVALTVGTLLTIVIFSLIAFYKWAFSKGYNCVIEMKLGYINKTSIESLWPKEDMLDSLLKIRSIYTEKGDLIISQPLPKHYDHDEDDVPLCVNIMENKIRIFWAHQDALRNIILSEYKDFNYSSYYHEVYEYLINELEFDYYVENYNKQFIEIVMSKIKDKVRGSKEEYQNPNLRVSP